MKGKLRSRKWQGLLKGPKRVDATRAKTARANLRARIFVIKDFSAGRRTTSAEQPFADLPRRFCAPQQSSRASIVRALPSRLTTLSFLIVFHRLICPPWRAAT
jgi:hypothetical protein